MHVREPREERSGVGAEGTVIEALPHAMFAVELDGGRRIVAHMSGMTATRVIRVVPGNRVTVEISPYDSTRGRITRRHR